MGRKPSDCATDEGPHYTCDGWKAFWGFGGTLATCTAPTALLEQRLVEVETRLDALDSRMSVEVANGNPSSGVLDSLYSKRFEMDALDSRVANMEALHVNRLNELDMRVSNLDAVYAKASDLDVYAKASDLDAVYAKASDLDVYVKTSDLDVYVKTSDLDGTTYRPCLCTQGESVFDLVVNTPPGQLHLG